MANCRDQRVIAGRHNCRHCKRGTGTCWIHQFTPVTLRTQFAKLVIDVFSVEERRGLHEAAESSLLPLVVGDPLPLDQLPAAVANRELDAAAVLIRLRREAQ